MVNNRRALGCVDVTFVSGWCIQKKLKDGVEAIIEGGDPSLPGVDDEEKELLKVVPRPMDGLGIWWYCFGTGLLVTTF